MASWVLVACLKSLFDEFDELNPDRDDSSDGSIGDSAHASSTSDHNPDETGSTSREDSDNINEVHAIDVDCSGPWPNGMTFTNAVNLIVDNHKYGRDSRLYYVIWNRKIAEESNGWKWRDYSGSNPHDKHGHFSAKYDTTNENDTSSWGLVDEWGDTMNESDFKKWMTNWSKSTDGKKAFASAAYEDCVQRYDAQGQPVPASDPNPYMGINSGIGYTGRDLAWIKEDLNEVKVDLAELKTAVLGEGAE
jgi:hypothetical protein